MIIIRKALEIKQGKKVMVSHMFKNPKTDKQ